MGASVDAVLLGGGSVAEDRLAERLIAAFPHSVLVMIPGRDCARLPQPGDALRARAGMSRLAGRCSPTMRAAVEDAGEVLAVVRAAVIVLFQAAGRDVTPLLGDLDLSGVTNPDVHTALLALFNKRVTSVQQPLHTAPASPPAAPAAQVAGVPPHLLWGWSFKATPLVFRC